MDVTSDDVHAWVMSKADDADLRLLQEVISMKLRLQFKVGDKVKFDAKTRGIIHGTVTKMNAKSAKVLSDKGVTWNVSPQFLEKVV